MEPRAKADVSAADLVRALSGRLRGAPDAVRRNLAHWVHRAATAFQPYCKPSGKPPLHVNGKPCIWLAWTGSNAMPGYLQLCVESVRRHNAESFEVIVLTPANLRDYLDDLHPAYEYLSYVHRADYVRCEILHRRGGIYLDVDTICFKSLRLWYELLDIYDIVNYDGSRWKEVFGTSLFGPTRRDSSLTRAWSRRLRERLDLRRDDLQRFRAANPDPRHDCLAWTEILRNIVVPVARELQRQNQLSFFPIPLDYFQVASEHFPAASLFSPAPLAASADAHLLILNNALYPDDFRQLPPEAITGAEHGMAHLLRQALGHPCTR